MRNKHLNHILSSLAFAVALTPGAFAVPASSLNPANNSTAPAAVADVERPGQTVLTLSYTPTDAPAMPPSRVTVTAGDRVVVQSGNAPADWPVRWSRNGQPIPGATTALLTLNSVNAADAGIYSATLNVPSGTPVITQTLFLDVTPAVTAPVRRQTNLLLDFGDSTMKPAAPSRLTVAAGDYVLLQGTPESPNAIVKWVKNNLFLGVTGNFLLLPTATAADAGTYYATINLPDGREFVSQTVVVGVGTPIRLANLSTRATLAAGPGESLVSGFVVAGTGDDKKIIVRAVGPSLAQFGFPHTLQRPALHIYDASGKLYDNGYLYPAVQGGLTYETDLAESLAKVGAFPTIPGAVDVVRLMPFAPGSYTAEVLSADNTAGTVLLEIYEVP